MNKSFHVIYIIKRVTFYVKMHHSALVGQLRSRTLSGNYSTFQTSIAGLRSTAKRHGVEERIKKMVIKREKKKGEVTAKVQVPSLKSTIAADAPDL